MENNYGKAGLAKLKRKLILIALRRKLYGAG